MSAADNSADGCISPMVDEPAWTRYVPRYIREDEMKKRLSSWRPQVKIDSDANDLLKFACDRFSARLLAAITTSAGERSDRDQAVITLYSTTARVMPLRSAPAVTLTYDDSPQPQDEMQGKGLGLWTSSFNQLTNQYAIQDIGNSRIDVQQDTFVRDEVDDRDVGITHLVKSMTGKVRSGGSRRPQMNVNGVLAQLNQRQVMLTNITQRLQSVNPVTNAWLGAMVELDRLIRRFDVVGQVSNIPPKDWAQVQGADIMRQLGTFIQRFTPLYRAIIPAIQRQLTVQPTVPQPNPILQLLTQEASDYMQQPKSPIHKTHSGSTTPRHRQTAPLDQSAAYTTLSTRPGRVVVK